ncbi:hypothetical protein BGP77_16665 [Saccharospirillum sp. MSK14-1]|uniref:hypothetical protein n=1 Tax=Saccharospirillum sp. MSK14-1 TaxID=1897632 RepID=UPI000D4AC588|nr:hypothetical protein [Saccharospirillum sp. MSK14-1]PTY38344.1 hypothetical protein BGP77_16665 [Saccharospirillum sp. MSK14-1]
MKLPGFLESIEIKKVKAPATHDDKNLPFNMLEPRIFERFCCELLWKKYESELNTNIVDILPIGVSGQKQYGADIFVKESGGSSNKYALYEVKRVGSFSIAEYKKTVSRFLHYYESWGLEITEFNVFVAENISADEIILWQREASALSDKSINYKIIPSVTLDRWIKEFPELVYKYFHPAWTQLLYGDVGLWHLEKYGIWEFKEPTSWNDYVEPKKNQYGDIFEFINEHVNIYAFLPSLDNNSASCKVEFRNGRFSHVTITLSHEQLIQSFFSSVNIPIDQSKRPFLLERHFSDGYYCDIGNCRIELSFGEAESLCAAFDVFWEEYRKRVNNIEEVWRSKFFNYHTGVSTDVALIRVKRWLWSLLLDFAYAHDAINNNDGDSWAIFDSCPGYLKVYTKSSSLTMDAGHHAFIKPHKYDGWFSNFRNSDDEVVLAWQHPSKYFFDNKGDNINPRGYWDAKTTHDWLIHSLIPKALEWRVSLKSSRAGGFFERIFSSKKNAGFNNYVPQNYVASFYEPHMVSDLDNVEDIDSLLALLERLQGFFNAAPDYIFVDLDTYKGLYISIADVFLKSNIKNYSYFHGNLSYLSASDMPTLVRSINEHAAESVVGCDNSFQIDCALRCILVALRDYESYLNGYEVRNIVTRLRPLVDVMENRRMLNRQSRFV